MHCNIFCALPLTEIRLKFIEYKEKTMAKRSQKTFLLRQNAPRPLGLYMMYLMGGEPLAELTNKFFPKSEAYHDLWKKIKPIQAELSSEAFLKGVQRYRDHDWQRTQPRYEKVMSFNRAELLLKKSQEGTPILVVPSMVNRSYILDLMPESSLLKSLEDQGFDVYLLNWLDPLADDLSTHTTIEETVNNIIGASIDHLHNEYDQKVHLAGYCMGGTIALAAASMRQEQVASLTLIATPWDFSAQPYAPLLDTSKAWGQFFLKNTPLVPIDVIQGVFVTQDPKSAIERLIAYENIEDDDQLKRMTAIEDWLADGIALEGKVAEHIYHDWFLENKPHSGKWWIGNHLIAPHRLEMPVAVVTAAKDKVVPTESSKSICTSVDNVKEFSVDAGHIGLMVGRKAKSQFYTPWADWLKNI